MHKQKSNDKRHETPVLDHPIKIIHLDNDLVVMDKPCSVPVSNATGVQQIPINGPFMRDYSNVFSINYHSELLSVLSDTNLIYRWNFLLDLPWLNELIRGVHKNQRMKVLQILRRKNGEIADRETIYSYVVYIIFDVYKIHLQNL